MLTKIPCSFVEIQAHVFKSKSGACAAFLANYNEHSFAKVAFGNMHYNLPPWSISILPDCKNTVYNTARVRKTFIVFIFLWCWSYFWLYLLVGIRHPNKTIEGLWIERVVLVIVWMEQKCNSHSFCSTWKIFLTDCRVQVGAQSAQMKMTPVINRFSWQSYNEETSSYNDKTWMTAGLLEQINTTRDMTDYLWYMTE